MSRFPFAYNRKLICSHNNVALTFWWIGSTAPDMFACAIQCCQHVPEKKGGDASQAELFHQNRNPTAEGQEAVKSITRRVNHTADQSTAESVGQERLGFLSGVSVRPEPQAKCLIPATVFDTSHCCLRLTPI